MCFWRNPLHIRRLYVDKDSKPPNRRIEVSKMTTGDKNAIIFIAFFVMLFAIFLSNTVFPAFGGATIIPLCPLPKGAIKSINRVDKSVELCSSVSLSFGKIGVKLSKFCSNKLDETEKKVSILLKDEEGNVQAVPFRNEISKLKTES